MRFFEAANQYNSRPVIYVDMDGVLADMFGEVARHHGVESWRDAADTQDKVDQLAKKPGFFQTLKPLPHSGALIATITKLAGSYGILSCPLMSNVPQSTKEKSAWLSRYLGKTPPHSVIFDHEKFKYARQADGTPNVLIDDYETNIRLWEANGGIGVLYDDKKPKTAIKQLKLALKGDFKRTFPLPKAVINKEKDEFGDNGLAKEDKRVYTNKEVLKYIKKIHHEYHLEDPILAHKFWKLVMLPTEQLNSPEKADQDDPYRRIIDLDWDHIKDISTNDIMSHPIVADDEGWVLDGNHRVTAARAASIRTIPALIPYQKRRKE